MEAERETAGVTLRAILRYVRSHAGDAAASRVLDLAGEHEDPSAYEDTGRWWSYDTKIAIFGAAARVLSDDSVGFHVGQQVLGDTLRGPARLGARLLGGPAPLIRLITRASSRFSTAADMETLRTGPGVATVRYRLRSGRQPSRFDCDYTRGLLTQLPVLFGLPPATLTHDTCQVLGADACVYTVRWRRRRIWPWPRADRLHSHERDELTDALATQIELLQRTIGDVATVQRPDVALATVADRARLSVNPSALLLVARPGPDRPPEVHGFGLPPAEVARLAALRHPAAPDPDTLIADIASPTQYYGYLMAYFDGATDTEPRLLEAYANLAAVALDSLRAFETATERQLTADRLLAYARSLTFAGTPEAVARLTAEAAQGALRADAVAVLLIDERGGGSGNDGSGNDRSGNDGSGNDRSGNDGGDARLRVAAHVGFPPEEAPRLDGLALAPHDTDRSAVFLTAPETPHTDGTDRADPFPREILTAFRIQHAGVAGVRLPGRVYGMIVAGFAGPPGAARNQQFAERLEGIADQAALALCNCDLLAETRRLPHVDAATGLANRPGFLAALASAVTAGEGCLLLIDLDDFKTVNGSFGHTAGDRMLAMVARRLAGRSRKADLVARLGGNEFAILSPDLPGQSGLEDLTRRVRAAFDEPVTLDGASVPVRLSLGGTRFAAGDRPEDVLHRADTEISAAKRTRLRVVEGAV